MRQEQAHRKAELCRVTCMLVVASLATADFARAQPTTLLGRGAGAAATGYACMNARAAQQREVDSTMAAPAPKWSPDPRDSDSFQADAVVQFVLDTLGDADPGTIRVLWARNEVFAAKALEFANVPRFGAYETLPGCLARKVMVIPIDFGQR